MKLTFATGCTVRKEPETCSGSNLNSAGTRKRSRLARVLPAVRGAVTPQPGTGRIAGSALTDAVGSGMFMSGAVIFFSSRLGLSAITIGGGFAVAGVISLLVVAPLGTLADRFGYTRSLQTAHLVRAAIYPFYLLVNNAVGFTIIITLLTIGDRVASPVFQAVVATTVGDDRRTETMGYVRALRNAGFSLGAMLTSIVIAVGTPASYDALVIGNGVSFAVAGILLLRVGNVRAPRAGQTGSWIRAIRPRYLGLAALNVVMLLHDTILQLALPLYIIKQTDVPTSMLPLMFALNTVLVMALQRRLSRRVTSIADAARAEQTAGYYLAATCACMAVTGLLPPAGAVIALVVGVVLLTIGESLQIAGAWELSHSHAPVTDRGAYLAVFSIGLGAQRSVGPGVVSLFAVLGAITWLPLAGAFVLAGTAIQRFAGQPWPPVAKPADTGHADQLNTVG